MKVQSLSKSFGNRTLFKNLSFEINYGTLLLKGENGCGKSTLIKILAKFDDEFIGSVDYGFEPTISFMSQEDSLCSDLSFKENYKIVIGDTYSKLTEILIELLEFSTLDNSLIINLSKGERMKAEIIFALSKLADIYLLDEPFASLDNDSRIKLVKFLNEFSKDHLLVIADNSNVEELLNFNLKIELSENENKIEENTINPNIVLSKVEKTPIDKSKTRFIFTKAFFRARTPSLLLLAFLFLISCVTMSLGFDFTNFRPFYESEILSLKDDPMEQFHIRYNPSEDEEILPFEIIEGQEVLIHSNGNAFIFKTNEDIDYVARVTNYTNLNTTNITIGEKEYVVKDIKIGDELVTKYLPNSLEFKRIAEYQFKYIYYFVTASIFDSIFINGISNVNIDRFTGYDYRIKMIDKNIVHLSENSYPEYYENIKIVDTTDFDVSFVDFLDGEEIYLYNDCDSHITSEGKIKVVNKKDDNIMYNRISLRMFKLFLTSLGTENLNYKCFHNKEDCKNILYKYKSSVNLVINNIIHNNNKNDLMIIFFSISLISFIFFLILFVSIVIKNRKWKRSIFNFYSYNFIDTKTKNRDVSIFAAIFIIPLYLISVIVYLACLPLANLYSFKHWQVSLNEFFDSNIMINFYRYSPVYLLTVIIVLLVVVLMIKTILYQKRTKK